MKAKLQYQKDNKFRARFVHVELRLNLYDRLSIYKAAEALFHMRGTISFMPITNAIYDAVLNVGVS